MPPFLNLVIGLPNWLKVAMAGAVVIGVLQVRHVIQVRALERQVSTLTADLKIEQTANAQLRVGLADVSANRDMLASRLREQSRAIELLQVRAKEAESASALLATRALAAGRKASEALRAPTSTITPGHEGMNRWLQAQFAR